MNVRISSTGGTEDRPDQQIDEAGNSIELNQFDTHLVPEDGRTTKERQQHKAAIKRVAYDQEVHRQIGGQQKHVRIPNQRQEESQQKDLVGEVKVDLRMSEIFEEKLELPHMPNDKFSVVLRMMSDEVDEIFREFVQFQALIKVEQDKDRDDFHDQDVENADRQDAGHCARHKGEDEHRRSDFLVDAKPQRLSVVHVHHQQIEGVRASTNVDERLVQETQNLCGLLRYAVLPRIHLRTAVHAEKANPAELLFVYPAQKYQVDDERSEYGHDDQVQEPLVVLLGDQEVAPTRG